MVCCYYSKKCDNANVRNNEVGDAEGREEGAPAVEDDYQGTENKSVPGAEELAMCPVRILFVISVIGVTIFECVIVAGFLNCMIKVDVACADNGVDNED